MVAGLSGVSLSQVFVWLAVRRGVLRDVYACPPAVVECVFFFYPVLHVGSVSSLCRVIVCR